MRGCDVPNFIESIAPLPAQHTICGWYRRGEPEGHNLNIVVPHNGWVNELQDLPINVECTGKTGFAKGEQFLIQDVVVNICAAEDDYWGATVLQLTGNTIFNMLIRSHAKKMGLKLNQYGLWDSDERIAGATEYQIFYMLDLEYVPPEQRGVLSGYKLVENKSTHIKRR